MANIEAPDKGEQRSAEEEKDVQLADGQALVRTFRTGQASLAPTGRQDGLLEAAKRRAQQQRQSVLGSVLQTKRTVMSNNWTD